MKAKLPKLTPQQKAQILGHDVPQAAPDALAGAANSLAGLHTLCTDSPRRLISLWDIMTEILPNDFHDSIHRLDHDIKFSSEQGTREATPDETAAVLKTIDGVRYYCLRLGLKESEDQCDKLNNWLKDPSYHRFPSGGAIPSSGFQYIYRALEGIAAKLRK